jgi:hypothetical protein
VVQNEPDLSGFSSYVVSALKSDRSLPFEMDRLKALVQMEAGSWRRHCEWILEAETGTE